MENLQETGRKCMKKRLLIVACLLMVLCVLSSCGSDENNKTSDSSDPKTGKVSSATNGTTIGDNKSAVEPQKAFEKVLVSKDGMTVTLIGEPTFEKFGVSEQTLFFPIAVKNSSDRNHDVGIDECYLNGTKIDDSLRSDGEEPSAVFGLIAEPGYDAKTNITVAFLESWPDFQSLDDLKEFRFVLVCDGNNFPVTLDY